MDTYFIEMNPKQLQSHCAKLQRDHNAYFDTPYVFRKLKELFGARPPIYTEDGPVSRVTPEQVATYLEDTMADTTFEVRQTEDGWPYLQGIVQEDPTRWKHATRG